VILEGFWIFGDWTISFASFFWLLRDFGRVMVRSELRMTGGRAFSFVFLEWVCYRFRGIRPLPWEMVGFPINFLVVAGEFFFL
jgi:hypothetical protein